jgi:hypothetical protein
VCGHRRGCTRTDPHQPVVRVRLVLVEFVVVADLSAGPEVRVRALAEHLEDRCRHIFISATHISLRARRSLASSGPSSS